MSSMTFFSSTTGGAAAGSATAVFSVGCSTVFEVISAGEDGEGTGTAEVSAVAGVGKTGVGVDAAGGGGGGATPGTKFALFPSRGGGGGVSKEPHTDRGG